jgi:Icc-related predicted phosphoesterase
MKIAAIGDLHVKKTEKDKWANHFKAVSQIADVVLLCGDLTENGESSEAKILSEELKSCSIPIIAVLGNHDYEKNQQHLIREILSNEKIQILDGESTIINNVGFAGVKGFGGGFDKYMLAMFGENMMKKFVEESVSEALKLDSALRGLDSKDEIKKIAILHYSPIKETVIGEPAEIFPFMGSSRLIEPINRRQVIAAFHGHAHLGTMEGSTSKGVKIFNVSKSILEKAGFNPPFYIFEI